MGQDISIHPPNLRTCSGRVIKSNTDNKDSPFTYQIPISYTLAHYLGLDFKPYYTYPWTEIRDMIQQVLCGSSTVQLSHFQEVRKMIYEEQHWPYDVYIAIEQTLSQFEQKHLPHEYSYVEPTVVGVD